MSRQFIDREVFVTCGMEMSIVSDETMNLKTNNDLMFYGWMLKKGITEITGGVKESFELTWEFHKELFDKREAGTITDRERQALETFEDFMDNYEVLFDQGDEAGD
jgi:hypothetical protein